MKEYILDVISDLTTNFVCYDREGDELLSREQLKEAVKNGEISIDEMVAAFKKDLTYKLENF